MSGVAANNGRTTGGTNAPTPTVAAKTTGRLTILNRVRRLIRRSVRLAGLWVTASTEKASGNGHGRQRRGRSILQRLCLGLAWIVAFMLSIALILRGVFALRPDYEQRFEHIKPIHIQLNDLRRVWHDVMGGALIAFSDTELKEKTGETITWEHVMADVAIAIKTGHEVSEKRLHDMRQSGWLGLGHKVPNLLVISDRSESGAVGMRDYGYSLIKGENVTVSVEDFSTLYHKNGAHKHVSIEERLLPKGWFKFHGWKGDKDKNLPGFHLLRTVYPGKKWYIMLDDDTYIFLDNFANFAHGHDDPSPLTKPLYTGKVFFVAGCAGFDKKGYFHGKHSERRAAFAHGGSGIVLNGAAMNAIYEKIPECMKQYSSCWAGDMQVALCLREQNIEPEKYEGGRTYEKHFTPFCPSKALHDKRYTTRWYTDSRPITFHKVPLEELQMLSEFERKAAEAKQPVQYDGLRRFLIEKGLTIPFPVPRGYRPPMP